MKRQLKKNRHFTLVEIIVSMALFMLLMGAVTRFFYAANTLWTDYGRKNALYSDARIAMNLIATDLQNSFFQADDAGNPLVPFWNDTTGTSPNITYDKLCFYSELPDLLNSKCKSRIAKIQYKWFEQDDNSKYVGELKRYAAGDYYSDGDVNTNWNFPPTTPVNSNDFYSDPGNDDKEEYKAKDAKNNTRYNTVIPNVVKFQWTCYNKDGSEIAAGYQIYPYSVRIDLELLDSSDYKKYVQMLTDGLNTEAEDFKNRRRRVFSREIMLGDRGQ